MIRGKVSKITTIKALRLSKKLKQEYIAARLKISRGRLKNYENNTRTVPKHIGRRLAEIYDVSEYTIYHIKTETRFIPKEIEMDEIEKIRPGAEDDYILQMILKIMEAGIIKNTDMTTSAKIVIKYGFASYCEHKK